jgi:hypothetical protein
LLLQVFVRVLMLLGLSERALCLGSSAAVEVVEEALQNEASGHLVGAAPLLLAELANAVHVRKHPTHLLRRPLLVPEESRQARDPVRV